MERIQEILNKGWKSYNRNHKVVGYKKKAITAIAECKTGAIEHINMYVMNVDMKK